MAFAASRAAVPWGGAVFRRVHAELAKGWPPGLTVLTGDDLYHLDRAQAALLAHLLPPGIDAWALSVVGDAPIGTAALVGAARSAGMFASRRVVLLRDVSMLEGEGEPLTAYATRPPAESWIVVRAPKLDRKRKLHKALAEAGRCLEFRRAAGDAEMRMVSAEVAAMAGAAGASITSDAAALLLDVCGADLHRASVEIDKLVSWLGGSRTEIRVADVQSLVAGSALLADWELADAVTARASDEAAAAARRLVDAGGEPIRALGGIASRARALLKAKALEAAGASPREVIDGARAWYFRDALAKGLKRYTLAELRALPSKLYGADKALKSRGIDRGAILETLVLGVTTETTTR
jgi:DNA polymerase III delta subunit